VAREGDAARLGELHGREAERVVEGAAQVAGADAERGGEVVDAPAVEEAGVDEAHGAVDEARRGVDGRVAGGELRAAAEARAEAGALRLGRRPVERAALAARRARGADRAAVDAGRRHADEEEPVEAGVPRRQRPVAGVAVDPHVPFLSRRRARVWPFSDVTATSRA
jgi:hypothetical protein